MLHLAAASGVEFVGLWLTADADTLMARVSARIEDASDADAAVVARQLRLLSVPDDWQWLDAGSGPDEIIFTACNMPNKGEIKEAPVVGAAIALKARMRMVPIHTIGIKSHGYDMMAEIAKGSGGTYLNLYE